MTMPPRRTLALLVPGALAWLALAVRAPWGSVSDTSSVDTASSILGWGLWIVGTIAVLVPSAISLTFARYVAPLAVGSAIVAADPWASAAAAVVLVVVATSRFADLMVQGGAYGNEQRFCLRTPVPHMVPAALVWAAHPGSILTGVVACAAGAWPLGITMAVLGAVLTVTVPRRLHRLATRWLVVVPAGVVVHDHLVLGETFMVRRSTVTAVRVAPGPSEAADLTGGVAGARLEISLSSPEKVILSEITARLAKTTGALHVSTCAVAPRRPAAFLVAARL
ncbi:MAG: hypothetical protein ACKOQ7_00940 [Actinomycetota bacterium]